MQVKQLRLPQWQSYLRLLQCWQMFQHPHLS